MLCVLWVLHGVVTFRCIPRLLKTLNDLHGPLFHWIPHFTSVINWTLRIGLGLLNAVAPVVTPWIAMMDMTMNIGKKKALVVLRVHLETLSLKGSAIQLEDCECIGLRILEDTHGEAIAASLTTIFKQSGAPVAILKDQGSDLARGVCLYKDAHQKETTIEVIDDIGHVLANGLKAQFEKTPVFQKFLTLVTQGAHRLRQTQWAHLMPPKIRTKGRFQSIGKLAQWGSQLLDSLNPKSSIEAKLAWEAIRRALPGLSRYRQFIQRFAKTTQITHDILAELKHSGLNQTTYEKCKAQVASLSQQPIFKKRLLNWLDRHQRIQAKLTSQHSLLVSTDILESLFGKFKRIIERSPTADINRMALIIPALCGNRINERGMKDLFSTTRQQDIDLWEQKHIVYTVRKKRRAFFGKIQQ